MTHSTLFDKCNCIFDFLLAVSNSRKNSSLKHVHESPEKYFKVIFILIILRLIINKVPEKHATAHYESAVYELKMVIWVI